MRTELIDYINTLALGSFTLSQELPWEESGTALFLKNPKKIYVNVEQYENEPFIQTLSAVNINNETAVVDIIFSCDAKQLPANYSDLVADIKAGKDITTVLGVNRRQVNVETEIVNDLLVTTVGIRFTKLST